MIRQKFAFTLFFLFILSEELLLFSTLAFFGISSMALAGPIPDTGQTKCYNNTEEIPCPQPGEPFYGQDGNYLINPPSYTKLDANGNALSDAATSWVMVRDNVTNLIWEVKRNKDGLTNYDDPHDADNTYTWYDPNPDTNGGDSGTPGDNTDTNDFLEILNNTQFGGYSDWRLPTVKEFDYIIDNGIPWPEPKISAFYFPNAIPSRYWSSTSLSYGPKFAWYLNFGAGGRSDFYKTAYYYVRAVRGKIVPNEFIDNGDGTVTDHSTGLMWQKGTATDEHGTYALMTWKRALIYCESLYLGGYSDWRLPNIKELSSLIDYNLHDPAINTAHFPNTLFSGPGYRSSTTYTNNPDDLALGVNFVSGIDGWSIKSENTSYVRAVRGGVTEAIYISKDGTCGGKASCFSTIQRAVDSSSSRCLILICEGLFNEDLIVDHDSGLTLSGGWDSSFTTQASETVVHSLTIEEEGGAVEADRVVLK